MRARPVLPAQLAGRTDARSRHAGRMAAALLSVSRRPLSPGKRTHGVGGRFALTKEQDGHHPHSDSQPVSFLLIRRPRWGRSMRPMRPLSAPQGPAREWKPGPTSFPCW